MCTDNFEDSFQFTITGGEIRVGGTPEETAEDKTATIEKLKKALHSREVSARYETLGELGRGGMGIIYNVKDCNLHRPLAMKVLLSKGEENKNLVNKALEKFIEEAYISAQLEHPNIAPVHDVGVLPNGNVYFMMKLVEGEHLHSIINKLQQKNEEYCKEYSLYKRLTIFRKVCDSMAFAHARKVVHRDIKPENIMIGEYGEVFLMDWGLAKFIGDLKNYDPKKNIHSLRTNDDFSKTEFGFIQGTPLYFAPEQILGDPSLIDERSDIYLLGATLYHMVTLLPPHAGKDLEDLMNNVRQGNIIPPQKRNPEQPIPEELDRIIMKSIATDKKDRYQTVKEFAEDIDNYLNFVIPSYPLRFQREQFFFHEGDMGTEGYQILKGEVKVFRKTEKGEQVLATLKAGDIVGEMAIITSEKRSASVVATEDTNALVISKEMMNGILAKLPDWTQKIIESLADRLRSANTKLHPLKLGENSFHIFYQLACVCSLKSCQQGKKIEEIAFSFSFVSSQIAKILCIKEDVVSSKLYRLFMTEFCEMPTQDTFYIPDFSALCQLVNYLNEELCIDQALLLDTSSNLDQQTIEKIANHLLEFTNRDNSAKLRKIITKQITKKHTKKTKQQDDQELIDRVKNILKERLVEVQILLEKLNVQDSIVVKYSLEAKGKKERKFLVEGELLRI